MDRDVETPVGIEVGRIRSSWSTVNFVHTDSKESSKLSSQKFTLFLLRIVDRFHYMRCAIIRLRLQQLETPTEELVQLVGAFDEAQYFCRTHNLIDPGNTDSRAPCGMVVVVEISCWFHNLIDSWDTELSELMGRQSQLMLSPVFDPSRATVDPHSSAFRMMIQCKPSSLIVD